MKRVGIAIGLVMVAACSHGGGGGGGAAGGSGTISNTGEGSAGGATAPATELGPAGSRVTLRGRVSDNPWQHMMHDVPGKQPDYFDYADGQQTVVYWAARATCTGEIEVTGVVIEVSGASKRPPRAGEPPERYSERSVDVETARCVE